MNTDTSRRGLRGKFPAKQAIALLLSFVLAFYGVPAAGYAATTNDPGAKTQTAEQVENAKGKETGSQASADSAAIDKAEKTSETTSKVESSDAEKPAASESGSEAEKPAGANDDAQKGADDAADKSATVESDAQKVAESDNADAQKASADGESANDAAKGSASESKESEQAKDVQNATAASSSAKTADETQVPSSATKTNVSKTTTLKTAAATPKIAVTVNVVYRDTTGGWLTKTIKSATLSSGSSTTVNVTNTYKSNKTVGNDVYEFTGWDSDIPSTITYDMAAEAAGEGTTATFTYTAQYTMHPGVTVDWSFDGILNASGETTSTTGTTVLKWTKAGTSYTIKAPKTPAANSKTRVESEKASYYFTEWQKDGETASFPITVTYADALAQATYGRLSYAFTAQYDKHADITVTKRVEGIRNSTGEITAKDMSSTTLGWGDGTSINVTQLESATGVKKGNSSKADFSYMGYKFHYTGEWEAQNAFTSSIDLASKPSIYYKDLKSSSTKIYTTEDVAIVYAPVYTKTMIQGLDYYYIDNVSTGSGSWSNSNAMEYRSDFGSLTHTFKNPEVASPNLTPHYRFVHWQDIKHDKTYEAGDSFTYTVDSGKPEGYVATYKIYAVWQPSVTVNYHNFDGTVESVEKFDGDITTNDFAEPKIEGAEFLGWYTSTGEEAASTYALPETTTEKVERTVYDVYARYSTTYKVEHAQQNVDNDEYTVVDSETETYENIVLGTTATAVPKEFAGFTYNKDAEGTLVEQLIDHVGIVLKLFYDRNSYGVTYAYTGFVPEDATELPAAASHKYGSAVDVADAATATGYTFSGWSRQGTFEMPAENVVIEGSWSPNTDTAYTVRHWLQDVEGDGYSQDQSVAADEALAGTTGQMTQATARQITGFTAQEFEQAAIAADGSTIVDIYYDRNTYTVSYSYTGTAPADASALPAQATFRFGADVAVADPATATGYTFSGWDHQGTFAMPAENVTITGSFTAIPVPVPATDEPEGDEPTNPDPVTPVEPQNETDPTPATDNTDNTPATTPETPETPEATTPDTPTTDDTNNAGNPDGTGNATNDGNAPVRAQATTPAAPVATTTLVPIAPAATPAAPAATPAAPAAATTPAPAAPAAAENVSDDATPLAETIEDDANALASGILGSWSLFDLIAMVVTAGLCVIMLVRAIGRKRKEGDDENEQTAYAASQEEEEDPDQLIKRRRALRIASLIPAIGSIILFILTQDLTQPMVIFGMWSIAFAIIALINIVLAIASRKKTEDDEEDDEQQGYAPAAA